MDLYQDSDPSKYQDSDPSKYQDYQEERVEFDFDGWIEGKSGHDLFSFDSDDDQKKPSFDSIKSRSRPSEEGSDHSKFQVSQSMKRKEGTSLMKDDGKKRKIHSYLAKEENFNKNLYRRPRQRKSWNGN